MTDRGCWLKVGSFAYERSSKATPTANSRSVLIEAMVEHLATERAERYR